MDIIGVDDVVLSCWSHVRTSEEQMQNYKPICSAVEAFFSFDGA